MPRAPRLWPPSGVVSLLTDHGLDEPYVGLERGAEVRFVPHRAAGRRSTGTARGKARTGKDARHNA